MTHLAWRYSINYITSVESRPTESRAAEKGKNERFAELLTPAQEKAIAAILQILPEANERIRVIFGIEYTLIGEIYQVKDESGKVIKAQDGKPVEKVYMSLVSNADYEDMGKYTGDVRPGDIPRRYEKVLERRYRRVLARLGKNPNELRENIFKYGTDVGIQDASHFLTIELVLGGWGMIRILQMRASSDIVEVGDKDQTVNVFILGGKPYTTGYLANAANPCSDTANLASLNLEDAVQQNQPTLGEEHSDVFTLT